MSRFRVVTAWPLAVALIFLAVFQAALCHAVLRATNGHLVYPMDDTYIQMAIAKTLAAHGVWGVTRYEFSSGGSSLLWPWLLAAADRLIGLDERAPFLLNAASAIVLVTLAYEILMRHLSNRLCQALALVLLIVATPLTVLVLVGMEHTIECIVTLGLAVVGVRWCVTSDRQERRFLFGLTLLLAPLTVAVRYDAASILVPLLVLVAITRGWRAAAAVAICGAAPAVVYAGIAMWHGWPALPTSILIKQRLVNIDPWSWHGAADLLGGGALTVLAQEPALFVLVLLAVALVAWSPRDESALGRESRFLLIVFIGGTLVHVQFGRLGWLYRYEAYLMVLGIVANISALAYRIPAQWPRLDLLQRAAALTLAGLVLHPLLLRGFSASREVLVDAKWVYPHEYLRAQFFRRHPPDSGLLIDSLGVFAYFTDLPIVDPSGLATLELFPSARARVFDPELVLRVAHTRGARIAMGNGVDAPTMGWRCVAGWRSPTDPVSEPSTWLWAADATTASHLARDLKVFAATEDPEHVVSLTFADNPSGACPADR